MSGQRVRLGMWSAAGVVAALVLSTPTIAEDFSDRLTFSGLIETRVATETGGGLQKSEFIIKPELGLDFASGAHLTLNGRIRGDQEDLLEPGSPTEANRSDWSRRHFASDDLEVELRDAYLDFEIMDVFVRIGKQQIVWGQADGIKVLDVLNPQSFREFILDDFDDSRIPLWSVNAEASLGNGTLQFIWIPDPTYDDLPGPEARFAFTSSALVPPIPRGVPLVEYSYEKPEESLNHSDFAARYSLFVDGWDLTANYAWHFFDRPVTWLFTRSGGLAISQTYERTHLIGGTFSNAFGSFVVRGEAGYSTDRYFVATPSAGNGGVAQSGELSYVLGLDYQGWTDWFVSSQLFQSHVADHGPAMIRDEIETRMTILARRNLLNEALVIEALAIHDFGHSDGLIQFSLEFELSSDARLKAGVDFFYGDGVGLFGQFDDKDRFHFGIEVGF